jgi:hypothetical protein
MTHSQSDTPEREDIKSTVLIASENVLAKWSSSSAAPVDLLALADADADQALAVIERRRPHFVVLEQMFAASARGTTFVNNLRANWNLAGVDIRILPAERSAVLGASAPITGRLIASVARSLRYCGPTSPTRRARRIPMPIGAETHVDGAPAALINLSTFGVQVVSPTVLNPNKKVKVVIDRDGIELSAWAEVAWCSLELASNGIAYRAGVGFVEAQPELLKFESIGAGL